MGTVEALGLAGSIDVDPRRADAPSYALWIHHARDIRDQRPQAGQVVVSARPHLEFMIELIGCPALPMTHLMAFLHGDPEGWIDTP
jgi:hypothetical protein